MSTHLSSSPPPASHTAYTWCSYMKIEDDHSCLLSSRGRLATSASACSRGPVGILSQQAGCPDSINSEEWVRVLLEVCALRHLLCTFFNTSITNICPLVTERLQLRSFCPWQKKSEKVKGLSLKPGKKKKKWSTVCQPGCVIDLPLGDSREPVSLDTHTDLLCLIPSFLYEMILSRVSFLPKREEQTKVNSSLQATLK